MSQSCDERCRAPSTSESKMRLGDRFPTERVINDDNSTPARTNEVYSSPQITWQVKLLNESPLLSQFSQKKWRSRKIQCNTSPGCFGWVQFCMGSSPHFFMKRGGRDLFWPLKGLSYYPNCTQGKRNLTLNNAGSCIPGWSFIFHNKIMKITIAVHFTYSYHWRMLPLVQNAGPNIRSMWTQYHSN